MIARKPYRDGRNAIQFDGYFWIAAICVPWWVGVVEMIRWVVS